jgi:hypothetical protein
MSIHYYTMALVRLMLLTGVLFTLGKSAAVVSVSPSTKQVYPSDTFSVCVVIDDVLNLHAASVKFTFDNSVIRYSGITQGSLLSDSGDPTFFSSNPSPGADVSSVTADQAILGLGKVSGGGKLLTLYFTAIRSGVTTVTLSLIDLRDTDNAHISFTTVNGIVISGNGNSFISVDSVIQVEGNSGTNNASFNVRLSLASVDTVRVRYATTAGTAAPWTDFLADSGQIVFSPGDTAKILAVQIVGDTLYESDETFSIKLFNSVNAFLLDSIGTCTIQNDDPLTHDVIEKWNILSVPLTMNDYRKTAIYPGAISSAYAYDAGYVQKDTLSNGVGYWMKFNIASKLDMSGSPRNSDTLTVAAGWNMIGSISWPVPVANIGADRTDLVASSFFRYSKRGYTVTDTIWPGEGYWVKTNQSGKLYLSSLSSFKAKNLVHIVPSSELPPPPPTSALHAKEVVKGFCVEQNYPNPFNPSTTIRYYRPDGGTTLIRIVSMLGSTVFTVVRSNDLEGEYAFLWDGRDDAGRSLPTGTYLLRVETATSAAVSKMLLLK